MKKFIAIVISLISFTFLNAQEKNGGVIETSFKVEGVCEMCKKRIENSALRSKGVKMAEWDKTSKELKVVYNSEKISENEIHQAIVKNGHQTALLEVDSAIYKELPECCRYKDGAECKH